MNIFGAESLKKGRRHAFYEMFDTVWLVLWVVGVTGRLRW